MCTAEKDKCDALLLLAVNQTECNLDCEYCFRYLAKSSSNRVNIPRERQIKKVHSKILEVDMPRLMAILDDTGKTFCVALGGTEPFLFSNIIEFFVEITKKHILHISSNMISEKWDDFLEKINPKKVRTILASAHVKELQKRNLLDKYISNVLACKQRGFNVCAMQVAYPPLLNKVEEYKDVFRKKNIDLKFGDFRGIYNGKLYPDFYTDEEFRIFGLNPAVRKRCQQKGKLCNAGYNVIAVGQNGYVYPCGHAMHFPNYEGYRMGNIYTKFEFKKKMIHCPAEACICPVKHINPRLFEQAVSEQSTKIPFLSPFLSKLRNKFISQ